jgi:MYXO-CTERM domain-containing protein
MKIHPRHWLEVAACLATASAFVAPLARAAPLAWTQRAALHAPAGGADAERFGEAVALDGDTVVVGATGTVGASTVMQGAAYVYRERSGFSLEARFQGALGVANQDYGESVGLSGDVVVVGAPHDVVGSLRPGAAYVYERHGVDWTALPTLTASDGASNDEFGASVAIAGDTVVVGAPKASVSGAEARGAAYVFVRNGAGYVLRKKLVASDGLAADQFGGRVAISGSTVLVGDQPFGSNPSGAAYVFERTGTTFSAGQRLTPSRIAPGAFFGAGIALAGDQAVVTAYLGLRNGDRDAYLFVRGATGWVEKTRLTPPAAAPDDFGFAAAVTDDRAFVVALQPTSAAGDVGVGAVHSFERTGSTWTEGALITSSDDQPVDAFGWSIAASKRRLVVGAPLTDLAPGHQQGAAYIFEQDAPVPPDAGPDGSSVDGSAVTSGDDASTSDGAGTSTGGNANAGGAHAGGNTNTGGMHAGGNAGGGSADDASAGGGSGGTSNAIVDAGPTGGAAHDAADAASEGAGARGGGKPSHDDAACSCRLEAATPVRTNQVGGAMVVLLLGAALARRRSPHGVRQISPGVLPLV